MTLSSSGVALFTWSPFDNLYLMPVDVQWVWTIVSVYDGDFDNVAILQDVCIGIISINRRIVNLRIWRAED